MLGHTKLESAVRYLGLEVDDALEMAEHAEIWPKASPAKKPLRFSGGLSGRIESSHFRAQLSAESHNGHFSGEYTFTLNKKTHL